MSVIIKVLWTFVFLNFLGVVINFTLWVHSGGGINILAAAFAFLSMCYCMKVAVDLQEMS